MHLDQPNYWTAAVTKHGEEERAAHHTENQQFEFYLPRFAALRRGRDGSYKERRELLFPGYILIKLHAGWRSLSSTRGIARLFMHADFPVPMRSCDVDDIRAREDERGLVQLTPRLRAGQKVVVGDADELYSGVSGIVQDTPSLERCVVLLKMLGRGVTRSFDERVLNLA